MTPEAAAAVRAAPRGQLPWQELAENLKMQLQVQSSCGCGFPGLAPVEGGSEAKMQPIRAPVGQTIDVILT